MTSRKLLASALAAAVVISPLSAQQAAQPPAASAPVSQSTDYGKSPSHFPNPVAPFSGRTAAAANVTNASRITTLLRDGKLYLSLNDAVALALENNLDIAIARYNIDIAKTDVLRSLAGSALRGVNTGVVQNTPGGSSSSGTSSSSGSGTGGTSSGTGGAASGTAGIVTSTSGVGSAVDNFDPFVTGTLQYEKTTTPLSNTVFTGVKSLVQDTRTANFNYSQGFHTGTLLTVAFDNTRQTTNSTFTSLSPALNASFRATVRQHLLQGFGLANNTRFIVTAKNNQKITDASFKQQVISSVSQIENIYWDLVSAYEDVKVKERAIALAEKTLGDNKKQVEIGTLAPIEIVRAESDLAARRQDLIVSQTSLQLQQLLMKNAITRNENDADLAAAEVVPTDTVKLPESEPATPVTELIAQAIAERPDLYESQVDLVNRGITKKAARNALLPTVDVYGFYGASALGGDKNPANNNVILCTPSVTTNCLSPTGYPTVFGNLFDNSAPDKGVGVSITIPIRNRSAQADQSRAELEYRQAELRLQQLKNQISISVRNAQFAVQQNRARVEAAVKGLELAKQSLDAEQKKYALGASTTTLVLQAQRDLTQADGNLVAAKTAYEKARIDLDSQMGLTLKNLGIDIGEAVSGNVEKLPMSPYVTPRAEVMNK
jgi:outer membrane protein TolC